MKRIIVMALLAMVVVTSSTSCSTKKGEDDMLHETVKTTPVEKSGDASESADPDKLLTAEDIPEGKYRDEFEQLYKDIEDSELIDTLVRQTLKDIEIDKAAAKEEEKYGCSYELDSNCYVKDEEGVEHAGDIVILYCSRDYAEDIASKLGCEIVGYKAERGGYVLKVPTPFSTYAELEAFTSQDIGETVDDKYSFANMAPYSVYLYKKEYLGLDVTVDNY